MRFRSTSILFAAVVLLLAFILLVERGTVSSRRKEAWSRQALRIEPARVAFLGIESGSLSVECTLRNDQWHIVKPMRAPADEGAIDRILSGLARLPSGETITAAQMRDRGLGPEAYGLDPPKIRLTVADGRQPRVFLIGRVSPAGDSVYVREEGREEILSIGTNLLAILPGSLDVLRERRLLRGSPEDVRRIEVRSPDGFLQLSRGDQGQWMLHQPVESRADRAVIQHMLESLFALRVKDFVIDAAADVSPYGLDGTPVSVALGEDAKGELQTLLLGSSPKKDVSAVYAKLQSESSVFTVAADLVAPLRKRADELRDRRLIDLAEPDITWIRAEEGEQFLELMRLPDEGWEVVEPRAWKADSSRVQGLVRQWAASRIESFVDEPDADLKALGLDPPARVLRLARAFPGPNRKPAITNEIVLALSANEVRAQMVPIKSGRTVCRVPNTLLVAFSLDPLFYRAREVLDLAPDEIRRVAATRGGTTVDVERLESGGFRVTPPEAGNVDTNALAGILTQLAPLRAAAFVAVAPADLAPYGLDSPREQIVFSLKGDSGISRAILLGRETEDGGRYAMLRGQEVVFTLDKDVSVSLTAPFVVRRAVPVRPGDGL